MHNRSITKLSFILAIASSMVFALAVENTCAAQSNDEDWYKYDDYCRIPKTNDKIICATYSTNRGNHDTEARLVFRLDYPHGYSEFEQIMRDRFSKEIYHYLNTYKDTKGSVLYMPGESAYPMLDYYGVTYLNKLNDAIPVYVTDTLGFKTEIEIVRLCESDEYVTYKEFFLHDDPYYSAMAHASVKEEYCTYSKQSYDALEIEDIFKESCITKVKELLVARLALAFSERREETHSLSDVLYAVAELQSTEEIVNAYTNGKEFTIPVLKIEDFPIGSIALLPNGVLFHYPKYMISYGYEGEYTIILNYGDVSDFLKPEIASGIKKLSVILTDNSEISDPQSETAIGLIAKGDYDSAESSLIESITHGVLISSIDREKRLLALIQSGRGEYSFALSTYDSLLSGVDEEVLLTSFWTETLNWATFQCLYGNKDDGKKHINSLRTKTPIRPILIEDYMGLALAASIEYSDDIKEKIEFADLEYRINTAISGNTLINRLNYLSRILRILTSEDIDDSYRDRALTVTEEMMDILDNNVTSIYPNEVYGFSQLQVYTHDIWDLQKKRAMIYAAKKDYQSAAECLKKGFGQLLGKSELEDLYYLDVLSELYLKAGQNEEANNTVETCYTKLVDYTKRAAASLFLDERNSLYNFTSTWLLEGLPYIITSTGESINTGDLFTAAMVGKNLRVQVERDLSDILYASNDRDIIRDYDNLRLKLREIDNAVFENKSTWTIDSLKTQYYSAEKELSRKSQAFGNYLQTFSTTYSDVLSHLAKDDAAIEFINFKKDDKDCYYAIVLSKKLKQPKIISLFQLSLNQARKQLSIYDSYDKVWAPILKECKGIKRFFFSPSGVLSISPIENCMELPSKDVFIRLSSCREVLSYSEQTQHSQMAALFGGLNYDFDINSPVANVDNALQVSDNNTDYIGRGGRSYLPGTLEEVQDIRETLQKHGYNVSLYVGDQGTESSFKSLSGSAFQVLHIATHGFYFQRNDANRRDNSLYLRKVDDTINIDDVDLTRSGLLMTGANRVLNGHAANNPFDDGILSSVEISRLDFSELDLVVLSACESGLGEVNKDGVAGLQRGFKKAGAKSLLISLWEVDDAATSLLMRKFYEKVVAGTPYREALKTAQDYLREYDNGRYSNYKYWAAFVLLD